MAEFQTDIKSLQITQSLIIRWLKSNIPHSHKQAEDYKYPLVNYTLYFGNSNTGSKIKYLLFAFCFSVQFNISTHIYGLVLYIDTPDEDHLEYELI